MNKIRLIIIILLFSSNIFAKEVSQNKAEQIAGNFLKYQFGLENNRDVSSVIPIIYQNQITIYAVNFTDRKSVLVAADDRSKPIIAYLDNGIYTTANNSEAFDYQIMEYSKQMKYLSQNQIVATKDIINQWKKFSGAIISKGSNTFVLPLLTTIWGQGCYFNDSTPTAGGPCNHVVTGCVATAMAQVINYYEHPTKGSGQHTYMSNYGNLSADFGNTNYNFSIMPDTLSATSSAAGVAQVAQLMSHCGIAVEMNYSPGGSGAYSQDAANAFTHYFNFDNALNLFHKSNYADSIWEQMVISELDSLHPLYYDGSGSGGHAFVCDGYDANGLFHFNWGWNGSSNGYFSLSNLNPSGMNFSNYCGAVFGMKPGISNVCTGITDTLTNAFGNISDGSYANFYQNNTNCKWLISPQNAAIISLNFYSFDLGVGDTLFVYDGNNTQANIIGVYTGNGLPTSLLSSSSSLFISFVSNSSDTASGWSAAYRSEYCVSHSTFSNLTDTISDGSGYDNYNNLTNCNWHISDSLNRKIVLEFDIFKTEAGFDFVKIYDGTNNNGVLLGSYDGHNLPPASIANSGDMFIEFISDGGVVDEGWKAHYYICAFLPLPYSTDSAELCDGDSLRLSPSPIFDSVTWCNMGIAYVVDTVFYAKTSGMYYYKANYKQCGLMSSPPMYVNINPVPNPQIGNDTTICDYNSLQISPGLFSAYHWNTTDTTQSIIIDSNMVNQYGNNFSVVVTDSNSCISSDTISIILSPCMGINSKNELNNIKIFPNPVSDLLWIINQHSRTIEISIIDNSGKTVIAEEMYSDSQIQIDVNNLSSGIYYLQLKQCTKHRIIRFVKE